MGDVLLGLCIILAAAKLGGDLAQRMGQPSVLGEITAGLVVGNAHLLGWHALDWMGEDPTLKSLAELGVIVLLFSVGLESTISQMLRVGASSLLVAILGVVAPFILGVGVSYALQPEHSVYVHVFVGATLTATSVGITARVLKDLGKSDTNEARIIMGAAVIDDVLGLVILAAVAGVIHAADLGAAPEIGPILWIVAKALLFLVGSLVIGTFVAPRMLKRAARLRGGGVLLGIALAFCFLLAWIAEQVGLAAIVGAFAAGLILESAMFKPFEDRGEQPLEHLIEPVVHLLSPVFFVLTGLHVDLSVFAQGDVVVLALALTAAAVAGKQAAMLGVLDGSRRLPIGLGMIPRGEVGLIFANMGLALAIHGERVVDAKTYGAVVVMVVVTTLLTPPLLGWSLRRP